MNKLKLWILQNIKCQHHWHHDGKWKVRQSNPIVSCSEQKMPEHYWYMHRGVGGSLCMSYAYKTHCCKCGKQKNGFTENFAAFVKVDEYMELPDYEG